MRIPITILIAALIFSSYKNYEDVNFIHISLNRFFKPSPRNHRWHYTAPFATSTIPVTPDKRKMFSMDGRKAKQIITLFDGNTSTGINVSPFVNESTYMLDREWWIVLDSNYNNFGMDWFDSNGSGTALDVTLIKDNTSKSYVINPSTGFLDAADSLTSFQLTTNLTGVWRSVTGINTFTGVRYIRVKAATYTDLQSNIMELRLWGDATSIATSIWSNESFTGFTDPGKYWNGLNMLDDFNMDTAYKMMATARIGYEGSRMEVFPNNWGSTPITSFQFDMGKFGGNNGAYTRVFSKATLRGFHVQNYFNGGNLNYVTDSSRLTPYNYSIWNEPNIFKYIQPGADSNTKAAYVGEARRAVVWSGLYGSSTSVDLSPYTLVNCSGCTDGQGGLEVYETRNEWTMDWKGIASHLTPKEEYFMQDTIYNRVKAENPTMKVYLGAMTFFDTTTIKAMYWAKWLRYKNTKYMPFDGMNCNVYINDEYDGQGSSSSHYAITPGRWRLRARMQQWNELMQLMWPNRPTRISEFTFVDNAGSPWKVPTISGKTLLYTMFDWTLKFKMHARRTTGFDACIYYNAIGDNSGAFNNGHAFKDTFNAGGAKIGTLYSEPGNALRQDYDEMNAYNAWSNVVTDGDSTGVSVQYNTHPTDATKRIWLIVKETQTNSTTSSYDLNLGSTCTAATLVTPQYSTVTPTRTGLTVTGGHVTIASVTETVQYVEATYSSAGNQPPDADCGASTSQTITAADLATLNGTASTDPDGTISTYAWTKTSGPSSGYTVANASAANTTVSFTSGGTGSYVFTLTVTDNGGLTNTCTVNVTVNAVPPPATPATAVPISRAKKLQP